MVVLFIVVTACESIAVPGDESAYMANVLDQIGKKTSAAMAGVQPAAGTTPAAP